MEGIALIANAWLDSIDTPSWQPPDSWFGPVWTVLYVTIAVAFVLCLRAARGDRKPVLVAFGVNIALNAAWTPLFFGLQSPLLGGLAIVPLLVSCLWLVRLAWRIRPEYGLLLVPYTAWVAFATVLNWTIVFLNL